jgi:hypothetical protein
MVAFRLSDPYAQDHYSDRIYALLPFCQLVKLMHWITKSQRRVMPK